MRCETYRYALLEVAAAGGELNERVLNHAEECPQCRATLQRERALFVRIDGALRARMEEMPRAGFLLEVCAQISQEPEPKPCMSPIWTLAAVSVMVALIAMTVPWARLRKQPIAIGSPTVSTIRIQPGLKVAGSRSGGIPQGRSAPLINKQVVASNVNREPEVLVPADEREALAKFVTHLRQRDGVARAFGSPQVDENDDRPEISPVEIARLQLTPLTWESWK